MTAQEAQLNQQIIQLSSENVSVNNILKEISQQTELDFVYDAGKIPLNQIIEFGERDQSLQNIFKELTEQAGVSYKIANKQISLTKVEKQPQQGTNNQNDTKIIRGTVLDQQSNDPLIGVTVILEGINQGTVTDIEGNYKLSVPSNAENIVFSYVGYQTQTIEIGSQSQIDVFMSNDISSLQEVVVTALAIKKPTEKLGYATQKVDGTALTKAQEPNIVANLTGKVAGLTVFNSTDFFQNSSFELRGQEPLIVIDGVPNTSTNLWELNSNDVESIDVLKGAPASALYGSLGRNGAIMITTKRGSQKEGLQVEFSSNTMVAFDFLRRPEMQDVYGSGRNGQYGYINGTGAGTEGSGFTWGPRLNQPDPSTPSGFVELVQYNSPRDPETGELIPIPWINRGGDNLDNFFRNGVISNNTLAVTAGNMERNVRVSASHKQQSGIVPNTSLSSSNFSVAGKYTYKKLTVDASLNYNKQQSDNIPEIAWSSQSFIYNLALWMGPNIDVNDLRDYWVPGQEGFQQRHYSTSFYNNPYFLAYEYNKGYYRDVTYGQVLVSYDISDDLSVSTRNGINYFSLNRNEKEPISFVRNFNRTDGNYSQTYNTDFTINTDVFLNYSKNFNENFNLQSTVGVSNNYRNSWSANIRTNGLNVPDFYNVSNSKNALSGYNSFSESRISSAYATIDFGFLNSIYLGITGRNDWVTTLPIENNSFFYPSVSLSYVASKMFNLPDFISNLRIRGSWAEVSNGSFGGTYSHIPTYNSGINWQNNASLSFPGTLISPDLQPETSSALETGIAVGFIEDRLTIDANYIYTLDYNNITSVPISISSGYSSQLINANEFERKGFELVLKGRPIRTQQFQWNITANLSQYRTYIKTIDVGDRIGQQKEGDRTDKLFRTVWLETPDGKPIIGSNGINIRDPFDRHIGYSDPDYVYGFLNNFNYRNFSLFVGIDGRIGGIMESKTIRNMWWSGVHPETVNEFRAASVRGVSNYVADGVVVVDGAVEYDTEGNIIRDTRSYEPNSQPVNYETYISTYHSRSYGNHYYDETFIKLREVTLSYNFPNKWLDRTFLSAATVSLIGRNLFILSNIKYIDPDSGNDQDMQTPSMRNVGFHVNVKF
ncbi:SusC/RagA family TonB-linked outer membrane protein [Marivirga lumbricoides]|uniref:SusC/RagA family TonB-linked outer membrane protein n=2 Tax=Marivirga lumbricoides TaxID=1046115 RepID=A0ABQ1MMD0_9BACT|nr:SusC/RagA family TonB-linked outer membrane protein [Marivirga lumbricoides]